MSGRGVCRLCGRTRKLCRSHIVPRFVTKWLKGTSATGGLVDVRNPNVTVQDSTRLRLLCEGCEQTIASAERPFAEEVFLPFHEGRGHRFTYEEWLLRFAVSLAWRTGCVFLPGLRAKNAAMADRVEAAWETWGKFLRREEQDTKPYAHHVVFLNPVVDSGGLPFPNGFNRYLLGGWDVTIAHNQTEAFAYAKLCGIFLVSFVDPPDPPGWSNTKLRHVGIIGPPQRVQWPTFCRFVLDRAAKIGPAIDAMSEHQAQLLRDRILADPDRLLQSRSFEAIVYDRLLRSARKRNDERDSDTDKDTEAH